MGRRRRSKPTDVDAVLVVDKAAGPTSHDVVQDVRRAAEQSRVGHTGTLDPAATGVLVVCLGRATKLVQFLQAGAKTYAATMRLGVTTASQDADGEVLETVDAAHIDERGFCEAMAAFQGDITQIPPMVSAVKVDGERLHEKARRGETVAREPRPVTIHDLVLDAFEPGVQPEASFLVTCTAGTYVRTLAADIGDTLGVGGSLSGLRRMANGPFIADEAHTVDQIREAGAAGVSQLALDPVAAIKRALPVVEVDVSEAKRLVHGGWLPAQGIDGPFAVMYEETLVAIHADEDAQTRPQLVWTRPEELAKELA